jgi:hypothetical protein
MGQTVWGGRAADSAAGISWDWIEITKDVIAISDPMMMITNLRVLGRDGGVMCAHEAAPYLNQLVNGLPWQVEVLKALGEGVCEPQGRAPLPMPPRRPGAERRARARAETMPVG